MPHWWDNAELLQGTQLVKLALVCATSSVAGHRFIPFGNLILYGHNETGHASIGVWTRTAGNQFATTFMGYDTMDGQTVQYKVRGTVELSRDGEEFTGPFVTEIFGADGNPLFTVTGTIQATRIHVEPLD